MAKFREFFSFRHFLAAMAIAALTALGIRAFDCRFGPASR